MNSDQQRKGWRSESGIVALEFLAVVGAWLCAVALLIDMVLVLGNGMVMQEELNRAALHASAQGCLSSQAVSQVQAMTALMATDITITARTPLRDGYDFQLADVADTSGNPLAPTSQNDATCRGTTGRDRVANGRYIWVYLTYHQRLFLLPTMTVERSALSVSNALNLEGR